MGMGMDSWLRRVDGYLSARPWRAIPRSVLVTGGAVIAALAVIVALSASGVLSKMTSPGGATSALPDPGSVPGSGGQTVPSDPPSQPSTTPAAIPTSAPTTDAYTGIILPDVLVVAPRG